MLTGPLGLDTDRSRLYLLDRGALGLCLDLDLDLYLGLDLGLGLSGHDNSVFFVDGLICGCNRRELHVWDIELLVDAVEETFAEWTTGEIVHDAVEEVHTGCHGLFVVAGEGAVGENAHAAFEEVDSIHVEEGQTFLAEDDLVLKDGLLD